MSNKNQKKVERIFEHSRQKPLSAIAFRLRLAKYFLIVALVIGSALFLGMIGYHRFESLSWIDSFLNASMILGGMGPVNEVKTQGGKIFAGCYALFSGLLFIAIAGLIFTPLIHRLLHIFHFEEESSIDK